MNISFHRSKLDKILLVDDFPDNITLLRKLLQGHYDLEWTGSGKEALEIFSWFKPDIVLLDIGLPDLNGYRVCKRIKQMEDSGDTKVVMLTARSRTEDRLKGYESGADDFLCKPFNGKELLAKLHVYSQLKSLKQLDSLKDNLLSLLTHEVQTPLNSIIPPLELILSDREGVGKSEETELLHLVLSSSRNLLQLFEKVKLLCELKSGFYNIRLKRCSVIDDILYSFQLLTGEPYEYQCDIADEDLKGIVDLDLLNRAFRLLFNYAMRHFSGNYAVKAQYCEEWHLLQLVLSIKKECCNPEELFFLFEDLSEDVVLHYHHSDNIDLAIVHYIIFLHMGRFFFAESVNDFQVTIELPMCNADGFVNQVDSRKRVSKKQE